MAVVDIGKPQVFSYQTTQTITSGFSGAGGAGGVKVVVGNKGPQRGKGSSSIQGGQQRQSPPFAKGLIVQHKIPTATVGSPNLRANAASGFGKGFDLKKGSFQ